MEHKMATHMSQVSGNDGVTDAEVAGAEPFLSACPKGSGGS